MSNTKKRKKILFFGFVIFILTGSILILSIMLINITNTAESLAKSLINRTTTNAKVELDKYFKTIISNLYIGRDLCDEGVFDAVEYANIDTYILPIFQNIPQLNTIVVADTLGNEYSLIREDMSWLSNRVYESKDSGMVIIRDRWKGNNLKKESIKKWVDYNSSYDPRKRPWFIGAMSTTAPNIVWWTQPYLFFTHQIPGITISLKSYCEKTRKYHVIEFDILLSQISEFTVNTEISEHGKTFILSNNYNVIGLPKENFITNADSIKKYILQPYDSVRSEDMKNAINKCMTLSENKDKPFSFYNGNEKWWARISEYKLGVNNSFIIGVIVPEKDFVEEVNKTRNVVVGGFAIVLIFIILIIRQTNMRRKTNIILSEQKDKITKQRDEILKQHKTVVKQKKEITDSIVYAERIQRALLPKKEQLDSIFNEYFVLLKPLHIVSGDFYWIRKIDKTIIVAAADCTGHGVPGAFMSMLGISFLNEIVQKKDINQANQILEELRFHVKNSLQQTGKKDESKDGMDIALYSINTETLQLQYSGAFNPLYIIRDNEIIQLKADRQPVAIHIVEKAFTNNVFQLQSGDVLYSFSDGYVDQFGVNGKKFKAKNFRKLLLDIHKKPFYEQKNILDKTIVEWHIGQPQIDDILVIGVKM